MQIKAEEISSIIKEKIKGFDQQVDVSQTGSVIQVGDGIAKIYGLDGAMAGEMLEFPGGLYGIALNLEEDNVGAVLRRAPARVLPYVGHAFGERDRSADRRQRPDQFPTFFPYRSRGTRCEHETVGA